MARNSIDPARGQALDLALRRLFVRLEVRAVPQVLKALPAELEAPPVRLARTRTA
jgi:hypothetical protein